MYIRQVGHVYVPRAWASMLFYRAQLASPCGLSLLLHFVGRLWLVPQELLPRSVARTACSSSVNTQGISVTFLVNKPFMVQ